MTTPRERLAALLERAIGVDGAAGGSYVQFADYLLSHGWIESGQAVLGSRTDSVIPMATNAGELATPASPAPSLEAREPLSAIPLPSELLGLIEALITAKADESRPVTVEERRESPVIYTNRLMVLEAARTALIAGIEKLLKAKS